MTKAEFYNKVLGIYQKTGQGTPMFIADKLGIRDLVEEMVTEGLFKIKTLRYGSLPDDVTICLSKGYCVEDDVTMRDTSALTCMRIYLGLEKPIELGNVLQMSLLDCIQNPEWMTKYVEWLNKNKEKLAESKTIEEIEETGIHFNDEELEYIKGKDWYKDNNTIKKCLEEMHPNDDLNVKHLRCLNEIISLENNPKVKDKFVDALKDHQIELEDLKKDMKIRKKINIFLSLQNQNTNQPTIDPSQVIIIEPVMIKENLDVPIEKRGQLNDEKDQ